MTKDEVSELVGMIPQGLDADVFLVELVNLALARSWTPLESNEIGMMWAEHREVYAFADHIQTVLRERNT